MSSEEKNIHAGHRQRLRQRYDSVGSSGFEEHTILELLLFYGIPQKDTNPIAHDLIERFGSLEGVLNASKEDLMQVSGIGENAATLLRLIEENKGAFKVSFSLSGLEGFDLYRKTIGIIGTGKIGRCAIDIAKGFGMQILAYDPYPQPLEGVEYTNLEELLKKSDIISLYCPLTKDNRHLINAESLKMIKKNAVIINTSRGALVNSEDLLDALKEKRLAGAALDVYEEEAGIFFTDQSNEGIEDDTLARLISMPNVIVTSHQGYLTEEALRAISETTLKNISEFEQGLALSNEIK